MECDVSDRRCKKPECQQKGRQEACESRSFSTRLVEHPSLPKMVLSQFQCWEKCSDPLVLSHVPGDVICPVFESRSTHTWVWAILRLDSRYSKAKKIRFSSSKRGATLLDLIVSALWRNLGLLFAFTYSESWSSLVCSIVRDLFGISLGSWQGNCTLEGLIVSGFGFISVR